MTQEIRQLAVQIIINKINEIMTVGLDGFDIDTNQENERGLVLNVSSMNRFSIGGDDFVIINGDVKRLFFNEAINRTTRELFEIAERLQRVNVGRLVNEKKAILDLSAVLTELSNLREAQNDFNSEIERLQAENNELKTKLKHVVKDASPKVGVITGQVCNRNGCKKVLFMTEFGVGCECGFRDWA